MNHIKSQAEDLNAAESGGASLARNASVSETCHASGTYHLTWSGPREHLRKQYLVLRDHVAKLLKSGISATDSMVQSITRHMADMCEEKGKDLAFNIVTTGGGNNMLDNHLSGSAYTAAWYVGLISLTSYTSTPVIADTAGSHATWAEDQNYSQGTRPAASFSAASGKTKALSGSGATFSMNGTTTIKGCFLISVSTKGGTTGTLYSAGLFTGGDKAVGNGDTLNVSYAASV